MLSKLGITITGCILILLSGCVHIPSPRERAESAQSVASLAGWHKRTFAKAPFVLTCFLPQHPKQSDVLTVYIEGDGFAWRTMTRPSDDPTPMNPVGLLLALKDPGKAVAYLARPCQFVDSKDWQGCEEYYWTGGRFAPEVIEASNQAIDELKKLFNAKRLVIVGYSGGGAVATLVAARRDDVVRLITVAGNLEPVYWAEHLKLQPLTGSLNPADEWQKLSGLPQVHWVGGKDKIISEDVARAYQARFPDGLKPAIKVVREFDHHGRWVDEWPRLLDESRFEK